MMLSSAKNGNGKRTHQRGMTTVHTTMDEAGAVGCPRWRSRR